VRFLFDGERILES